jgi:hypothetical protein
MADGLDCRSAKSATEYFWCERRPVVDGVGILAEQRTGEDQKKMLVIISEATKPCSNPSEDAQYYQTLFCSFT